MDSVSQSRGSLRVQILSEIPAENKISQSREKQLFEFCCCRGGCRCRDLAGAEPVASGRWHCARYRRRAKNGLTETIPYKVL
jgi:hypothetical protein